MSTDVFLVIGPASRELRRSLRPIEWVVLEDVALDARRHDDGVLVASTSAREVAEHLGLTPGAAARALASLRGAGLVTLDRQAGPAGRFGLSAYVLGPVPGLAVVNADEAPGVVRPRAARPRIELPCVADRHMAHTEPCVDTPGVDTPGLTGPDPDRSPVRGYAAALPATAIDDPGAGRATLAGAPGPRVTSRRPAPPADQLSLLDDNDALAQRSANRQP